MLSIWDQKIGSLCFFFVWKIFLALTCEHLTQQTWIPDPGLAEKLLFKMRIETQRTQLRVCIFVIIFFRFLKWTIATVLQLYIYEDVCYIWKINNCKQKVKKFYQQGIFLLTGFPVSWLARQVQRNNCEQSFYLLFYLFRWIIF